MTVGEYLASETFKKTIEDFVSNAKLETAGKTRSNYNMVAAEAFNEGIVSMITARDKPKRGSLEKSSELTKMLPDCFCKGDMGATATTSIIDAIKSNQTEGILNIGYEELMRREIENIIRIVYAIGVTTGFEIADDDDYRSMYLANKDRFILHGSEQKPKKDTKTKKE